MSSKIQAIEAALDSNTKLFLDEFHSLSEEELNWKPNDKTWSVAQNIQHLMEVNTSYFPIIEQIENLELPFSAKIPFVPKIFGNMILKASSPEKSKKIKTFKLWEPGQSKVGKDILYKYSKNKHQLVLQLKNSEKYIENYTLIHSPANKQIIYSLENAFNIIISHEKRHFNQAKRLIKNKLQKEA